MNSRACVRHLFPAVLLASPLLLFPGISVGTEMSVEWFGTGLVVAASIGALLCAPSRFADVLERAPRIPAITFCLFAGIAAWHGARHGDVYSWRESASLFLWLFPPLAVCAFAEETKRLLTPCLAILWAWDAALSILHVAGSGSLPFGLPQNVNWNAAFLAATAPFAMLAIRRTIRNAAASRILAVAVVALTGILICLAGSKGALLSLAVAAALTPWGTVFPRRARSIRIAVRIALALCAAAAILFIAWKRDAAADHLARDERIYLAKTTAAMIAERPLLGRGAPSFEQEFLPFRTPEYFLMRHPAIRTDHPHNEMLFIAAGFGLLGLIAWLVLLVVPILRTRRTFAEQDMETRLAFFSLLVLLLHAQLDLILFRPPTLTLATVFLGLLWNGSLSPKDEEDWLPVIPFPKSVRILCVCGGVLVCASALAASLVDFSAALISRRADKAEACGDHERALELHDRAARLGKDDPKILIAAMEHALYYDPARALEYGEAIAKTSTPDFGYVHFIAANACLRLNRFAEAVPLLQGEIERRPFSVLPLLMLEHAYVRLGDASGAAEARRRIEFLKRIRGLTEDDLRNLSKLEDDIQIELKEMP